MVNWSDFESSWSFCLSFWSCHYVEVVRLLFYHWALDFVYRNDDFELIIWLSSCIKKSGLLLYYQVASSWLRNRWNNHYIIRLSQIFFWFTFLWFSIHTTTMTYYIWLAIGNAYTYLFCILSNFCIQKSL